MLESGNWGCCKRVELERLMLFVRLSIFSECTLFLFAGTGVHSEIVRIWTTGVVFLSFIILLDSIFWFLVLGFTTLAGLLNS